MTLDGRNYEHGMKTDGSTICEVDREYTLSRRYSRFKATVGFADESPDTSPAPFYIQLDEKTVYSARIGLGRPLSISIGVSDAVRLRIYVDTPGCENAMVALGDPRLES